MKFSILATAVASFTTVAAEQFYFYPSTPSSYPEARDLTLVSNGEKLYFGDYKLLNDNEYAPVTWTQDGQISEVHLNPNTTGLANAPTWSNRILAIPADESVVGQNWVAVDPAADNLADYNTKFVFYGKLLTTDINNQLKSPEYIVPVAGVEGLYDLKAYWWTGLADGGIYGGIRSIKVLTN